MKLTKYILGLALIAGAATFTSCDQENEGAIYDGSVCQNVSFYSSMTYASTDLTEALIPVELTRTMLNEAYTANVSIEYIEIKGPDDAGENDLTYGYIENGNVVLSYGNGTQQQMTQAEYEAEGGVKAVLNPSSLTFAANEDRAEGSLSLTNMNPNGYTYVVGLTLSENDAATKNPLEDTQYSKHTVTVLCAGWVDAGTCTFYDLIFSDGDAYATDVPIQHAGGTNKYRIVSPWWYVWHESEADASTDNVTFYLNSDGTIAMDEGDWGINLWGYGLYYDSTNYGDYCYTTNTDNYYEVHHLLTYGTSLYVGQFDFEWNK